jgi:hypothetical protein
MAWLLRVLLVLGAVLPHGLNALAEEVATQGKLVLAQNLLDNVLWTRRPDRYTLQVLTTWRTMPAEKGTVPKPYVSGKRELPNIEVWLLKRDGASIPAYQRWQTPAPGSPAAASREPRAEVLFAYPLSEGGVAVAAVVCVDGNCQVKKIAPFSR